MKSKSRKDDEKKDRAIDFLHLYKKADESTVKLKSHEEHNDLTAKIPNKSRKDPVKSPNKQKSKQNNANTDEHQDAGEAVIESAISGLANNDSSKKDKAATKPIIRNTGNTSDLSTSKPKKRNKSVSFILEENDEVKVKKTKSEPLAKDSRDTKSKEIISNEKKEKRKLKMKHLKDNAAEKENNIVASAVLHGEGTDKNVLKDSTQVLGKSQENVDSEGSKTNIKRKKKKELKKLHKEQKPKELEEPEQNAHILSETQVDSNTIQEKKSKRKKKKHLSKTVGDIDNNEGEPAKKSRRKDIKPEAVAEDLENLNIGDNTHTLTNLLDEMVVVDKKKQKKMKPKRNKGNQPVTSTTNAYADAALEGSKLKEKWRKKRWNKDKKPFVHNKELGSMIIIDNLPYRIILHYKKLLVEHFSKCGSIKKIGVAEIYLSDDPKPVFSTTILFDDKDAALKALEEDNTSFEGNFIRIKQPLPYNKTTLVVHSYRELTEHALSSAFNGAGRIRSIKIITKKKGALGTAFIEFDGPAALDRAIQIADEIKIGGKKIHISKFEFRRSSKPEQGKKSEVVKNDESSDSSDD